MKRLIVLTLLGVLVCGISFAKDEPEEIRPTTVLVFRGFYRGFVFEIDGKKYLLNQEGGILELTTQQEGRK